MSNTFRITISGPQGSHKTLLHSNLARALSLAGYLVIPDPEQPIVWSPYTLPKDTLFILKTEHTFK